MSFISYWFVVYRTETPSQGNRMFRFSIQPGFYLLFLFPFQPASATWWLIGEPDLDPGQPPLVAIITPTTSDPVYITEQSAIDISGKAASRSAIDHVDWDSYNVDQGQLA